MQSSPVLIPGCFLQYNTFHMKNTNSFLAVLFFTFFAAKAQILNPVKWQSKIERKSATEYILTFEGAIEKGWHLYSLHTPKGGAAPFEIAFPEKEHFHVTGKASESQTITAYNEAFAVDEIFFVNKAIIRQFIKMEKPVDRKVHVKLTYQVCKQVCIPQKIYIEFDTQTLRAKEVMNFTQNQTDGILKMK